MLHAQNHVCQTKQKQAKIISIRKKGERNVPNKVLLQSIFDKLLEKIMFKRLYSYLKKQDILYVYQFGLCTNHSTIMAETEIVDNIREELDRGNSVLRVYLDLIKAYDTFNHEILFHKLKYHVIRCQSNKLFQSHLANRQQVTKVPMQSNKVISNTGVSQGRCQALFYS